MLLLQEVLIVKVLLLEVFQLLFIYIIDAAKSYSKSCFAQDTFCSLKNCLNIISSHQTIKLTFTDFLLKKLLNEKFQLAHTFLASSDLLLVFTKQNSCLFFYPLVIILMNVLFSYLLFFNLTVFHVTKCIIKLPYHHLIFKSSLIHLNISSCFLVCIAYDSVFRASFLGVMRKRYKKKYFSQ